MRVSRFIAVGVCFVVIVVGYMIIDLSVVVNFLVVFDPWPFFGYALASILLSYLFKTLRFVIYLRHQVRFSFSEFARLFAVSNVIFAIAAFTPAQIGDVLKLEYVRSTKPVARDQLLSIFAQEKLLDLCVLMGIFLVGLKLKGATVMEQFDIPAILTFLILLGGIGIAGLLALTMSRRLRTLARRQRDFIDPGALPMAVPLTIAFWLAVIWGWKAVWTTHGLDFSYFHTAFAIAGSTLVSIASMIPGAIGVSEVSTAASLMLFGAGLDESLTASLLARGYMIAIVINGLLFFPVFAAVLRKLYRNRRDLSKLYVEAKR